jgi:ERCC4-type nuclease
MQKGIFSIFPKKKKKIKKEKPIKIIVDHRERNSLVPSELKKAGFKLEIKELKVADFIVRNVAIERKTVNDFISSMKSRRLIKQLEEIQQYKNRLLIIEGIDEQELYTDSNEIIGMHPNAIRGFLLSILLKYKVPIIFSKNAEDTAKFITLIGKKKTNAELSLNVNKKSLNQKERMEFIIEGFPGIGPKTAKKLLKKFKTLKELVNASEEELKELIGKKAELIFKIINKKY